MAKETERKGKDRKEKMEEMERKGRSRERKEIGFIWAAYTQEETKVPSLLPGRKKNS